jgi:uncharacterized protein YjbI with pentapeptide repeats
MNETRRALVIGVSDYNSLPLLPFCKNDADEVYKVMASCNYEISKNDLLLGHVEADIIKNSIVDFFTNGKVAPQDTLIFYFSGHGIPEDRPDGDYFFGSSDIDPQRPYLKGFSFDDLSKTIKRSKSRKIIVILDCCYAGSLHLRDNIYPNLSDTDSIKEKIERIWEEGVGFLAACRGFEEAYGSIQNKLSIFTSYLINGLKPNPESVDKNGCVTFDSIGDYVFNQVMKMRHGYKQKPIKKLIGAGNIIISQYPELAKPDDNELYKLLLQSRVEEFNIIRRQKNFDYYEVNFNDKKFEKLNLGGANLNKTYLNEAIFQDINLEVSDLNESSLYNSTLKRVNLSDSVMLEVKLGEAKLFDVNLSGAILTESNLSHATLINIDLSYANLSRANLRRSNLSGANLYGANLSGADLTGANLSGADMTLCDLSFTTFERKELSAAKSLQGATFVSALSPSNSKKYNELSNYIQKMTGVRFAGIFDNTREIIYGGQRSGVDSKLSPHEKSILLNVSWLSWRLREEILQYTGRLIYVIEKYEQIILIQIPLSRSEIMVVSMEVDSNYNAIIKYVLENIHNLHDDAVDKLPLPEDSGVPSSSFQLNKEISKLDYDDLCSKIYAIDGVIFANVFDPYSSELTKTFCVNMSCNRKLLDPRAIRISVRNAWRVWRTRIRFMAKIGKGQYAMANYQRVNRITVPLNNNALLFIITRREVDPINILFKIYG